MLSEKMNRWEELKLEISRLEADIKKEVLILGKTQKAGNVKATFTKGRKTFDYEKIGRSLELPDNVIHAYTIPRTDWTKLVKALSPPEELMEQFSKIGDPSVSLKIIA